MIYLKREKNISGRLKIEKYVFFLAVVISVVLISLSNYYLFDGINKRFFLYMALSLLIGVLLMYVVFFLLFQRVCYAFLGGNILLFIGMFLNYCNNQLRGSALAWSDLREVGSLFRAFLKAGSL